MIGLLVPHKKTCTATAPWPGSGGFGIEGDAHGHSVGHSAEDPGFHVARRWVWGARCWKGWETEMKTGRLRWREVIREILGGFGWIFFGGMTSRHPHSTHRCLQAKTTSRGGNSSKELKTKGLDTHADLLGSFRRPKDQTSPKPRRVEASEVMGRSCWTCHSC